ncbi:MAG: hypothetical protein QF427_07945, partial [Flavobacteriales bacterium]|nr:hypothetical protein [Flavobacteriales bacterium]
ALRPRLRVGLVARALGGPRAPRGAVGGLRRRPAPVSAPRLPPPRSRLDQWALKLAGGAGRVPPHEAIRVALTLAHLGGRAAAAAVLPASSGGRRWRTG